MLRLGEMELNMQAEAPDEGGVAPQKRKRNVQKLTNGDRKWIVQRKMSHPTERFMDMQHAFKMERNPDVELKSGTVSGIVKQSEKWLSIADGQETGTRTRSSKEPELEAALYAWRQHALLEGKVRDEDLRDKARELAAAMGIKTDRSNQGLSFSSGWLDRFKKRNAIQQSRYNRSRKDEAPVVGEPYPQLAAADAPDAGLQHMPQLLPLPAPGGERTPALAHSAPVSHTTVALAHGPAIPQPLDGAHAGEADLSAAASAAVPPPYLPPGAFDAPSAAPYAGSQAAADRLVPPPPPADGDALAAPPAPLLPPHLASLGGLPLDVPPPLGVPDLLQPHYAAHHSHLSQHPPAAVPLPDGLQPAPPAHTAALQAAIPPPPQVDEAEYGKVEDAVKVE